MPDFVNTIEIIGDDALTDSIIYKSITEYLDDSVEKIGSYAFYGCKSLTSVNAPVATSIGSNAFESCTKLTSIDFPAVTSVGNAAFSSCSKLTSVNFPVATKMYSNAFGSCSALTSVEFPAVTSINSGAFNYCSLLETLILRNASGVATLSNTSAFNSTPIASGTGYIYVPAALVDSYKSATNWSTYAAQIRAIEDYPDICGG